MRGILRALWADVTHGGRGPGRLDDHAAVRQERDQRQRADDHAQAAEAALAWQLEQDVAEGQDPDRVPEHDLLRQRRLRRRGGLPDLLRARRRTGRPRPRRRSSPAIPEDPTLYDPVAHPERRPRAPEPRALRDVPPALPRRERQYRRGVRAPMPNPRVGAPAVRARTTTAAPYFANYVTEPAADQVHAEAGLRRRAAR